MRKLILYSRHACHLCEVMQDELQPLLQTVGAELEIRDVDERQQWREVYGLRVPALSTEDGQLLSEYHLDADKVLNYLHSTASR